MRYLLTFSNTPVPLASFPEMYKMWSFQDNFLSMMTPRFFDGRMREVYDHPIANQWILKNIGFIDRYQTTEKSHNGMFLMFGNKWKLCCNLDQFEMYVCKANNCSINTQIPLCCMKSKPSMINIWVANGVGDCP